MLFQKNIEPRCTYCQRGTPLDEEKILCTKQGVVAPGGSCRSSQRGGPMCTGNSFGMIDRPSVPTDCSILKENGE